MTVETLHARFGPDTAVSLMFQVLSGYILDACGEVAYSLGNLHCLAPSWTVWSVECEVGHHEVDADVESTALFCRAVVLLPSAPIQQSRITTASNVVHHSFLFF